MAMMFLSFRGIYNSSRKGSFYTFHSLKAFLSINHVDDSLYMEARAGLIVINNLIQELEVADMKVLIMILVVSDRDQRENKIRPDLNVDSVEGLPEDGDYENYYYDYERNTDRQEMDLNRTK